MLAFTNHDFRDMRPDIDGVRELLIRVATRLPGRSVPLQRGRHRHARGAAAPGAARLRARGHALADRRRPPTSSRSGRRSRPSGRSRGWPCKTVAGTYHHDNLDIDEPFHRWRYVFDEETFPLGALDAIGVAANNAYGVTTVVNVDPATGAASRRVLNDPAAAVAASHGS